MSCWQCGVAFAAGVAAAAFTLFLSARSAPAGRRNGAIGTAAECVVVLDEVTKDRYIHYLLRPATALGAAEVVWLGEMQAKGTLKGTTPYGRAMRREAAAPLKNLRSLFQVRRHLTDARQRSPSSLIVVGVVTDPSAAAAPLVGPPPPSCALGDVDFHRLRPRGAPDATVETVAFLFAGPNGRLTAEHVGQCDAVVSVLRASANPPLLPAEGDRDGVTGLNVSALVAITLHQFAASTASAVGSVSATSEKFDTVPAVRGLLAPAAAS